MESFSKEMLELVTEKFKSNSAQRRFVKELLELEYNSTGNWKKHYKVLLKGYFDEVGEEVQNADF